MIQLSKEEKKLKLRDIQAIDFGTSLSEIISSLQILITMFGSDLDTELMEACRLKVEEGFALLQDWGQEKSVDSFNRQS